MQKRDLYTMLLRWIVWVGAACLTAGCQTTGPAAGGPAAVSPADRSEKLLLRVDQLVGTYDVKVQRAAQTGSDPAQRDQWSTIGSCEVEGYPGKFRNTPGSAPKAGKSRETFLLDGTPIEVSQEAGTHLVAKVLPKLQNTARVVGVYVQVKPVGQYMETFSLPFDLECEMGRIYEVYTRDLPAASSAAD